MLLSPGMTSLMSQTWFAVQLLWYLLHCEPHVVDLDLEIPENLTSLLWRIVSILCYHQWYLLQSHVFAQIPVHGYNFVMALIVIYFCNLLHAFTRWPRFRPIHYTSGTCCRSRSYRSFAWHVTRVHSAWSWAASMNLLTLLLLVAQTPNLTLSLGSSKGACCEINLINWKVNTWSISWILSICDPCLGPFVGLVALCARQ